MKIIKFRKPSSTYTSTLIITISSDGYIFIHWLPSTLSQDIPQIEPLLKYDTKGLRLVCLDVSGFIREPVAVEESGEEEDGSSSEESSEVHQEGDEESEAEGEDVPEDEWGGIDA